MRALEAALNAMWAMEETALDRLFMIAERANDVTPEALEAYRAESLKRAERATVRDGVAIIEANGALFKRANLMDAMSGATSYEIMRRDLQVAIEDPKVKAVLFSIDSPGGEVTGAGELARAIFDARGTKPIAAYVAGSGASAAYWIASAVDPGRITIDPTAMLGSIGVQMTVKDTSAADEKRGVKTYRFVSSQSPLKNADPAGEEGEAQIKAAVDATAAVFIADVARNRGVATETVLKDFGRGGIFVGQAAVDAGLADRIGTFESVLAELAAGHGGRKASRSKGVAMSDEVTFSAAERDAAVAAAKTAEKTRVAGLRKVAAGYGLADADLDAAIDGDVSVEAFALANADKAAEARAAAATAAAQSAKDSDAEKGNRLTALKDDEDEAAKVAASKGNEPDADSVEAVAARISAA